MAGAEPVGDRERAHRRAVIGVPARDDLVGARLPAADHLVLLGELERGFDRLRAAAHIHHVRQLARRQLTRSSPRATPPARRNCRRCRHSGAGRAARRRRARSRRCRSRGSSPACASSSCRDRRARSGRRVRRPAPRHRCSGRRGGRPRPAPAERCSARTRPAGRGRCWSRPLLLIKGLLSPRSCETSA